MPPYLVSLKMLPEKLQKKINERVENNAFRSLVVSEIKTDFSSNDYLGFSTSETIFQDALHILEGHSIPKNGATGSRLLTGNNSLFTETEGYIARFHKAEAALIFNSGYDANVGFFSSIPQKGDVIFYDERIHASIRDGIQLSHANSYKFYHNDLSHLPALTQRLKPEGEVYVVTESVFSMDGDTPDIKAFAMLCRQLNFRLVVDEAHAVGVMGKGEGLVGELQLEKEVFARIVTFGKALGCHGAAILGSEELKSYLVNFARSFIYTTALPPHCVAAILAAYKQLAEPTNNASAALQKNIDLFRRQLQGSGLADLFIPSTSAIHSCIIPGNTRVKKCAELLYAGGLDVRPILSPTVPKGQERLRISLHSFNTQEEITTLVKILTINIK